MRRLIPRSGIWLALFTRFGKTIFPFYTFWVGLTDLYVSPFISFSKPTKCFTYKHSQALFIENKRRIKIYQLYINYWTVGGQKKQVSNTMLTETPRSFPVEQIIESFVAIMCPSFGVPWVEYVSSWYSFVTHTPPPLRGHCRPLAPNYWSLILVWIWGSRMTRQILPQLEMAAWITSDFHSYTLREMRLESETIAKCKEVGAPSMTA